MLRGACDFILFGNLFIALGAAAQGLFSYRLIHRPFQIHVICILFLSTTAVYTFSTVRLGRHAIQSDGSARLNTIAANYKSLKLLSILSLLGLLPFLCKLRALSLLILLLLGGLSICYTLPLIPFNGEWRSLREIRGSKSVIIAGIWALSSFLIPVIESGKGIAQPVSMALLLSRFFFIASLCIVCDIRDITRDTSQGIKTIPVLFGAREAKIIGIVCLSLSLLLILVLPNYVTESLLLPLSLAAAVQIALTLYAKERRNDYYFLFYIDGICILQYLFVLLSCW